MTASNINSASKHFETLTNGDGESESQVTMMVGGGQDTGRTLHGDVQQAKNIRSVTRISHTFFQMSLPLLSPTTGQYQTPTSPPPHYWLLSCPSPSTHLSPQLEGSTNLISTKAALSPLLT